MFTKDERRIARWYFGGLASACAACCTHPLDLIKVHLQTHQEGKASIISVTKEVVYKDGVMALYNGISASLCRQLTYSTTRFAIYEVLKQRVPSDSFGAKVGIAAFAGMCGGFVGTPADLVNVRMQNDLKLSPEKRRNYKHAIDGIVRVYKEEGIRRLWGGASTATARAVLMTVGQLSVYDQIKYMLMRTGYFSDNLTTHFTSSFAAGAVATSLTQPLDVLKTRAMNAPPGQYMNLWAIVIHTAKLGPLGFFKGYIPAFACIATVITQPIDVLKTRLMNAKPGEFRSVWDCIWYTASGGPLAFYKGFVPTISRLVPATIIVFVIYEQLRMRFGYLKADTIAPKH